MSPSTSDDFYWIDSVEPHAVRRREILAKYGDQVRKLYGYDRSTAVQVLAVIGVQLVGAYYAASMPWPAFFVLCYTVSGTMNQNLFIAQHELSHFMALKTPLYNKFLSLASNCPLVVPMSTKFRQYHQEHHSHLGVSEVDVDIPSFAEASLIHNFVAKIVWVFWYIIIYGLRPVIMRPKPIGVEDLVNIAIVLGFDAAVLYFWGFKSLLYLLLGSLLGGGLHPLAGHLIAEHYMFVTGQETYSYYGPLNTIAYNVGFHNEHHDFPQIPHTRLHRLRQIAPEYYNHLAYHNSWVAVIVKFLVDPTVGPWTRMRRMTRSGTPGSINGKLPHKVAKLLLEEEEDDLTSDDSSVGSLENKSFHSNQTSNTPGPTTRARANACKS